MGGQKGQKLTDQIASFTLSPLELANNRKAADDERKAIRDAIDKFQSGDWPLKASQEEESSIEQKDGDGDSEDSDN